MTGTEKVKSSVFKKMVDSCGIFFNGKESIVRMMWESFEDGAVGTFVLDTKMSDLFLSMYIRVDYPQNRVQGSLRVKGGVNEVWDEWDSEKKLLNKGYLEEKALEVLQRVLPHMSKREIMKGIRDMTSSANIGSAPKLFTEASDRRGFNRMILTQSANSLASVSMESGRSSGQIETAVSFKLLPDGAAGGIKMRAGNSYSLPEIKSQDSVADVLKVYMNDWIQQPIKGYYSIL